MAYPLEGIMAGKVEGMLRRGTTNTRYKDYFDIARLAQSQNFAAATLERTLREMCLHHQTPFVPNTVFLDATFLSDAHQLQGWQQFVMATYDPSGMPSFMEVIHLLRRLYLPIL